MKRATSNSPGGQLCVDGHPVAPVERLVTRRQRGRGLLGREAMDGAVLLQPCRSVHTFGMRFAIDVAFCDADGVVLRIASLRPGRFGPTVWRAKAVLEAEAGAFAHWGVAAGSRLSLLP